MKRIFAILLAALMLTSVVSASAMDDADNGVIKVIGAVDKSSAFVEAYGDSTKYGFDIQGYGDLGQGEQLIGSTYGGYGYHTFLNVDGLYGAMSGPLFTDSFDEESFNAALSAMSYNCAGSLVQSIGGLNLKLENSYSGDGNFVRINYVINNPTAEIKTFSLATTADVQVNNDDSAELKMLPNGKGAKLSSDNGNCMFTVDGTEGDIDSLWIGGWDDDYFVNMFNDSPDNAVYNDGDSAICWSWTERTLAPGQTLSMAVSIEVGVNNAPTITFNGSTEGVAEKIQVSVSDPNLGTVALYYAIDNGEEQVIEDISIVEGGAVCDIPLEGFDCTAGHIARIWAVDDAGERSEELILTFNVAHAWNIPRVVEAPTVTVPGAIECICAACGEIELAECAFGDANGDGIVDSLDAALILRYDALIEDDLKPLYYILADTNGDGMVDSIDAAQILKLDALLLTAFESASFTYGQYADLCVEYYGYYDYDDVDSDVSDGESGEPTDPAQAIIGAWTGLDGSHNPKTYQFFEDGTGTVTVVDLVYDVEWTLEDGVLNILKAVGDIEVYSEQVSCTIVADALVLTDAEGNNTVYTKNEDPTADEELIGVWKMINPSCFAIIISLEEDGTAEIIEGHGAESCSWAAEDGRLVFENGWETEYQIFNGRLFVTYGDEKIMMCRDVFTPAENDSDFIGVWENADAENSLLKIKFMSNGNAFVYKDYEWQGSWAADNGYFYVSEEVYGRYVLDGDALTLLIGKELMAFTKGEYVPGSQVAVPDGKTNYAAGAEYSYSKVTGDMGDSFFMPDTPDGDSYDFWADSDCTKLTDGITASGAELNESGALEGVSVVLVGTNQITELVIDLGESYSDISSVVFHGVRDAVANGKSVGFNVSSTMFYTSDTLGNWGSKIFTSFSSDELYGAPYLESNLIPGEFNCENFTYTFTFDGAVSGRYVRILVSSPVYGLQFDEILVLN